MPSDQNPGASDGPPITTGVASVETVRAMYAQLEYYREYAPYMMNIPKDQYAEMQEAKNADAALEAYRRETGEPPTYP